MVGSLEFHRRDVAEGTVHPLIVEPVDPAACREFDGIDGPPVRLGVAHELLQLRAACPGPSPAPSRTMSERMFSATRQPTIMRENASTKKRAGRARSLQGTQGLFRARSDAPS